MNIKYQLPVLAVRDMARARAFYADLFGQKVVSDFGVSVTFDGGFALQLDFDRLVGLPESVPCGKSGSMELVFEVDNFDQFLQKLAAHPEAELVHPPKEQDWLQRVVRLYDPDGHMIEVVEAMAMVVMRCMSENRSQEEIDRLTQYLEAYTRAAQPEGGSRGREK